MSKKLADMDAAGDLLSTVLYGVETVYLEGEDDPTLADVQVQIGYGNGLATLDKGRLSIEQTPMVDFGLTTTASRVVVEGEHGACIGIDNAEGFDATVEMPGFAPAGWWVDVAQIGDGQVTITVPDGDPQISVVSKGGSKKISGKGGIVRFMAVGYDLGLLTGDLAPIEPVLAIYYDESNWYPLGPDDATYVDSESAQAEPDDATRASHGWVPAFQYLGSHFLAQFSLALVHPVTGAVLEYSDTVEFTTLVIEEHRYTYGPPATATAGKTDADIGWTITTGVNGAGAAANYTIDAAPDFSTVDLVAAIVGTAHFAVAGDRAISTTLYGRYSLS